MKLSDLPTHEQVLAAHLDADPEYRREWERTALARAVAVKVIAQPAVARLESGEHNPAFPMLLRISEALGVELAIDISPTGQEPQLIGKRALRNALESFEGNGCTVVVAAT
jgi:transcriptional regulator with XRE-family HTH domain